jgi:hypothetical protein
MQIATRVLPNFTRNSRLAAMARPSTYRQAVADRIVEAVANGASIKRQCAAEGVPIGTLYEWAERHLDFAQRLEQARLRRYDLWEEELWEHAQAELGSDSMAAVQARRTLIDTMKWIMARRLPSKWSEQMLHSHQLNNNNTVVNLYLPVKGSAITEGAHDGARLIEGEAVKIGGS